MAEIRIERKRGPAPWPWLIGLLVLALLIWAIAGLVNTDRDNETMAAADSAGTPGANATAPGTMAPSTSGGQPAPAPGAVRGVAPAAERPGVGELGALMPLGVQDAGQTVSAGGTVLSKPAHGGFWLRSNENVVLRVKSEDRVKPGQQVLELTGTLEVARPGDAAAWPGEADVQTETAKHPEWQLTTQLYLDADVGSQAAGVARDSAARTGAGRAPAPQTRQRRRR